MVRIKFTACPRSPVVSPKFGSMASDRALEDSAEQRETSTEQLEQSLGGQQMVASVESSSSHEAAFDHESQSRDFEDSKTGSDTSMRLKVAATAALARITYDFGQSTMMKTHLGSLQNHGQFFPKGYGRPPGTESVSKPRANEVVMFEDFFTVGLRMPPHSVLVDMLCKFRVQLHQLMPNAIVQISKFIWVVTSCRGHPIADVFA
jgi:hypothetical protein